jgi:hypothetical protein
VLDLWPTEGSHRIEAAWNRSAEARQIEDRMTLPITDVTTLTRGGDEYRPQSVDGAEHATKLLIPGDVSSDLRAGESRNRSSEELLVRRPVWSHDFASR